MNAITKRPVDRLKAILETSSVAEQFENALKENKNLFVASLIDLYSSDNNLQACDPGLVIKEALRAATLKLPINKSLGFAYIVPYKRGDKSIPQFQIGYKGMIQLALRTGLYKHLNDGPVFEGELVKFEKLTGEVDLSGKKTSDEIIGYFAHLETVNGFRKTIYCTVDEITAHAAKYSKAFSFKGAPWKTQFESMAKKTMLRMLLSKYGLMSVDMLHGMAPEMEPEEQDYADNANSEFLNDDSHTEIVVENVAKKSSKKSNKKKASEAPKSSPDLSPDGIDFDEIANAVNAADDDAQPDF